MQIIQTLLKPNVETHGFLFSFSFSHEMNNYEVCPKKLGWTACHESCALRTLTLVDDVRMIALN